jgi:single-strand DNA-binding protein
MLSRAILIGFVGGKPEIKDLPNGGQMANFSLATSKTWRDKNTGDRKQVTHWHRIVVFDKTLVGLCESHIAKGSKLYVEGELVTRKYETDDGARTVTEIVLAAFNSKVVLLDRREGDSRPPDGDDEDYCGYQ